MSGQEGIAEVRPPLAEHIWLETPYPMTEELAVHVAAAVVAWIEETLTSGEVREAVGKAAHEAIESLPYERDDYSDRHTYDVAGTAALTAVTAALRDQP